MKIKQTIPQKNTAVVQNHNFAQRKKILETQVWKQKPVLWETKPMERVLS